MNDKRGWRDKSSPLEKVVIVGKKVIYGVFTSKVEGEMVGEDRQKEEATLIKVVRKTR